ncbi:unnamed protein product [Mytilus coruscus]|uniref:Uncharacterized protein n=1 Tax=Mytilus coruscus TaxID=42192 RepID=A0A6J8BBK5_MYTCO|nr:unnamed protein product [Mytilus coruscus]
MAIGLKQLKLKSKNQPEDIYENKVFSTTNKVETRKNDDTERPFYEDVDEDNHHKAKPNKYSEYPDKSQLYVNNESVRKEVLHEKEVKHLETKLPKQSNEKNNLVRNWKIATIILAVLSLATGSALISVTTVMLLKNGNPCENGFFSCQNGGECYVLNLKPKCACLNGFSGVNCSSTPCSIDPCQNNGQCAYSINSSQPVCECADGYSGNFCQVTPCSYVDCENNGTCVINGNISVCECASGFIGELCENYVCDFETNDAQACIFYQENLNTISWNRVSTGNLASYGPSGAADGIYYNLLQGSFTQSRIVERLVSWTIILNSPKCLSFKCHLYGTYLLVYIDKQSKYTLYSNIVMRAWKNIIIQVPNDTKKVG